MLVNLAFLGRGILKYLIKLIIFHIHPSLLELNPQRHPCILGRTFITDQILRLFSLLPGGVLFLSVKPERE